MNDVEWITRIGADPRSSEHRVGHAEWLAVQSDPRTDIVRISCDMKSLCDRSPEFQELLMIINPAHRSSVGILRRWRF